MQDPIKKLYDELKSKGFAGDENSFRQSLQNRTLASKYYSKNENELGVDKEYFLSHVYKKTNLDYEIEDGEIELRNARKKYHAIQETLYDNAKRNIVSDDKLFTEVEDLEKYISDNETRIAGLKTRRNNSSKEIQNVIIPNSPIQQRIIDSGIDKELEKSNVSTQDFLFEKEQKLVKHLSEEEKSIYEVDYQLKLEAKSNTHLQTLVSNLQKIKRTPAEDAQLVAAANALENSNKNISDLHRARLYRESQANINIDTKIKDLHAKRTEMLGGVMPNGIHDKYLENKMLESNKALKAKVNSIDKEIQSLVNKKKAVLKNGADESVDGIQYEAIFDRIDALLPGVSASPQTKLKAYAIAGQSIVDKLEEKRRQLSDAKLGPGLGPQLPATQRNDEQIAELDKEISRINRELKEISPIALLNRNNTAEDVKYSDNIFSNYFNAAKDAAHRTIQAALGTDIGFKSTREKAEVMEAAIKDAGIINQLTKYASSDLYGEQKEISKLQDENEELLKDRVSRQDKNGDRIEYWKNKESRDRYEANMRAINSQAGTLNDDSGYVWDMLGTTLNFGGELVISTLLLESGVGAAVGAARATKAATTLKKLYTIASKNKITKATVDAIVNPKGFEAAIEANKYSRGQRYIAEATVDGLKWSISSKIFGGNEVDGEEVGFSEGFLGGIGGNTVEDATKFVAKPLLGLMNNKATKILGTFISRTIGQIPTELADEEGEAFSQAVKQAGQSDSFVAGMIDIIANGMEGNERWETIKNDFHNTMGYEAQKDILVATAYLSVIMGGATATSKAKKIFFENGGDAKMLEDMRYYLKDVKTISYDQKKYHYTGEKWVDAERKDVSKEIADKLNILSPEAKEGDIQTIDKKANFQNDQWVDESGQKVEGDELDKIIGGFRAKETSEFGFTAVDKVEEGDTVISGDESRIQAKSGQIIYADKSMSTFSTEAKEGFTPHKLQFDEEFVRQSDGNYYRDQGSPISGSYEVKTGSEFRLSRAIKKANTRQGRALRALRNMVPQLKKITKEVNGAVQDLKIMLHDSKAYGEITDDGSRGHYNPNTHTVHINLGAVTGTTGIHEIIHPYLNAVFEADPSVKEKLFNDTANEYKLTFADESIDEAIIEYATDRIVYAMTPKLDSDPNFFSRVLNMFSDKANMAIPPDISMTSLIGAITGVVTTGKNPLVEMLANQKEIAADARINAYESHQKRAMELIGISGRDEDGKPISEQDIERQIEEGYQELLKHEDNYGPEVNGTTAEYLGRLNEEKQEWIDFIEGSDYPLDFKAALLAEVLRFNHNGEKYKERGYGTVDPLNKEDVDKVFKSGKQEGLLKQLAALRDAREKADTVQRQSKKNVGEKLQQFAVAYAPYRERNVKGIEGASNVFENKKYQNWLDMANQFAEELGISIEGVEKTLGEYGVTSKDLEASSFVTITATQEQAELFAAMMGTLAPDVQNSVMLNTYDEKGDDTEIHITFDSQETLKDFLKNKEKYGITDISINPETNSVVILELGRFNIKFANDKFIQDYGKRTKGKAKSRGIRNRFIEEGEYHQIIQRGRDRYDRRYEGSGGTNLNDIYELATKRLQRQGGNYSQKSKQEKRALREGVENYINRFRKKFGIKDPQLGKHKWQDKVSKAIHNAYDSLKADNSKDPQVKEAYEQLAQEIDAQYEYLTNELGIQITFTENDPYDDSLHMLDDVYSNKHLRVFKGGEPHPFLDKKDNNGISLNEKFRAVHDYFGHAIDGNQFGKIGEEAAWAAHSKMFSPMARKAMTTETRGQNSWVNNNPVNDVALKKMRDGNVLISRGLVSEGQRLVAEGKAEFKFAEQKVDILPNEFIDLNEALQDINSQPKTELRIQGDTVANQNQTKRSLPGSQIDPIKSAGKNVFDYLNGLYGGNVDFMLESGSDFENHIISAIGKTDMTFPDGTVYGFQYTDQNGKPQIVINSDLLNPETPIHEMAHVWVNAIQELVGVKSDGVNKQIIGEVGAENLPIVKANLQVARDMEKDGKKPKEIYLATGWERTKDNGKWKYDLPDGKISLSKVERNGVRGDIFRVKLSDLYDNKELYKSYPQLADLEITFDPSLSSEGVFLKDKISIKANIDNENVNKKEITTTLIHEIQHAIQDIEGFAKGGNINSVPLEMMGSEMAAKKLEKQREDFFKTEIGKQVDQEMNDFVDKHENATEQQFQELETKLREKYPEYKKMQESTAELLNHHRNAPKTQQEAYKRLAGETEARNAQTRMNYTAEERLNKLLSETADVAPQDQIVIIDALGAMNLDVSPTDLETIKQQAIADGTFMKAPNGQPTNLNERQWLQTRTPEFMNWFGDFIGDPENASKVVDVNGDPLVVYHGTNADFTEFEPKDPNFYAITEGWYFFTDNKEVAKGFGSNIMPVFLNIDNPTYEETGIFNTWNLYDDSGNYGFITKMTDTGAGFANEYVVENPTQIKSATDNVGTFSTESNDIRFMAKGNEQQNELTLENKLEYARQGQSIQRLSEESERGRSESGTINAVATVITEAVHRDVKEKQGISNPNAYSKIKQFEENALKEYAEQNGLIVDLPKGEVIGDGNESDVYHSEDNTKFVKVSTPNNYNSWQEMMDSIAIHNAENPNMQIKILGFTINKDGEFALKTEQPIAQGEPAPFDKIHQDLLSKGYEQSGEYGNGRYIHKELGIVLEDVKEDNVNIDNNGNLHYFDTDYYPYDAQRGGNVKVNEISFNNQQNPPTSEQIQKVLEKFPELQQEAKTTWDAIKQVVLKDYEENGSNSYLGQVMSNPAYAENTNNPSEKQIAEAMVTAIGEQGAKLTNAAEKSKFKKAYDKFFDILGKLFGITDKTPKQISDMTIRELAKNMAVDILSGKAIDTNNNIKTDTNNDINEEQSDIQFQKRKPLTTTRIYNAGEITAAEYNDYESSITLIKAHKALETATAIVESIMSNIPVPDQLMFALDAVIDFDNSEFSKHPEAIRLNNAMLNVYIQLAAINKAKQITDSLEDGPDKEFAKSVIAAAKVALGDISRNYALGLVAFNADITANKAFGNALLPPNANMDRVDRRNSSKEDGTKRTDKEEAEHISSEIKKRLIGLVEDPNGGIDAIINELIGRIQTNQGNTKKDKSAEQYVSSKVGKKSDQLTNKGKALMISALSKLKNIGITNNTEDDLIAFKDLFKGAIYIAAGRLAKAKELFIDALNEFVSNGNESLGTSKSIWDQISNSEEGKDIANEARREWAINKLKKINKQNRSDVEKDLFDELFDRLRSNKNTEVKKAVKSIEETIKGLSEESSLTQEQIDVLEVAIMQMENENFDIDSPLYQEVQEKIEELRDMVEILSGKNTISKASPEVKRRREIRKLINEGIKANKTIIQKIIKDYIEYGSLRYTLADMLAMALPKELAKELEKSVMEELENLVTEKRLALSAQEKTRLEKSIREKRDAIDKLQRDVDRVKYLNNSLDEYLDRLHYATTDSERNTIQRSIDSIQSEIESITGSKSKGTREEAIDETKNRISELKSKSNRTEEENIELKYQEELLQTLTSNKTLVDIKEALTKQQRKLYNEYRKESNKSEKNKKAITDINDIIESIKNGTYTPNKRNKEEVSKQIQELKEQLRKLKSARGTLEGLTERWTPKQILQAIQNGATDLNDFYAMLESKANIQPKFRKAIAYVASMVEGASIYNGGNLENTRIAHKAAMIIRNIKGQMQSSMLKKIFYSLVNEWAYESMLSHPTSTINSLIGSITGWGRLVSEGVYRLLTPSDAKAAIQIIRSMLSTKSFVMALGQMRSRSEFALNDLESSYMATGVLDRIWKDTYAGIINDTHSTKAKIAAKLIIKTAIAPVKIAMNVFASTDVYSRNVFRSWNEKWDAYDKLKENPNTNTHLSIIDAIHDELGYKKEIIDQANTEAENIYGKGFSLQKKEFIAKRILELREEHIIDSVLATHAEHTARKMLLINNPETKPMAKLYTILKAINSQEQEVTVMSLFGMMLKNQIIPFGRNLANFMHKNYVNTVIPISYVASKTGINLGLATAQYNNYLKTIKAKKEYSDIYNKYVAATGEEKEKLKKQLDTFIGGGVYVEENGKEAFEPYSKRDLTNDFIESVIGYAITALILSTYDDDENELGEPIKKPSTIRFTGSGQGLTYSEQKVKNYTPYSIQIEKDNKWYTLAKWPYIMPHPIAFILGNITDQYYNKNSRYGIIDNPIYQAMYYSATAPLAQSSQQGIQTIADVLLTVSNNDGDQDKIEKLIAKSLSNLGRQTIYPGALGFATDLARWATNKDVKRHENPYINAFSKMPYFDAFQTSIDYSPIGLAYKYPVPIKYGEILFPEKDETNLDKIQSIMANMDANNILKYYYTPKNIADDKDGSISIINIPNEVRENIRMEVALSYGKAIEENLDITDLENSEDKYISVRKAISEIYNDIFNATVKEVKHKYLTEYVREVIRPYMELTKKIDPIYSDQLITVYDLLDEEDPKTPITTILKESGVIIDNGELKFVKKLNAEKIYKAIEDYNKSN